MSFLVSQLWWPLAQKKKIMVMFLVECRILSLCAGYMLFHLQVGTQSYSPSDARMAPWWSQNGGSVRTAGASRCCWRRRAPRSSVRSTWRCAAQEWVEGSRGRHSSVLGGGSSVFDIVFHLRRWFFSSLKLKDSVFIDLMNYKIIIHCNKWIPEGLEV